MLTLNNLLKTKYKHKKIVGRGGPNLKTSGRGHKGQTSRAGKTRVGFEGGQRSLVKILPKLKGFTPHNIQNKLKTDLNITILYKNFEDGATISVDSLKEKNIINKSVRFVKIMNAKNTSIKKKFSFKDKNIKLTKSLEKIFS